MEKLSQKEREAYLHKMVKIGGSCDNPRLFSKLVLGSIKDSDEVQDALQNVVNHLIDIGCTKEEIEEAWNKMMIIRRKVMNYSIPYTIEWWKWIKIGDDLLDTSLAARDVLFERELKWLLFEFANRSGQYNKIPILRKGYIENLHSLIYCTDYKYGEYREREGSEIFKDYLTKALSCGWIGIVSFAILEFGEDFKICKRETDITDEKHPINAIKGIIKEAIIVAEKCCRFGIACALAEHIEMISDADRLRELARKTKQKIALDFYFYLEC